MKKYKDPIVKGITELARVALLAALPLLILSLESGSIDWRSIGIVSAVAVLRALDKMLHKLGEQTGNAVLTRGLTQF